jgi:anti-sigma B factor antagonist
MLTNGDADERLDEGVAAILVAGGRAGVRAPAAEPDGRPRLHVKFVDGTAVVRFVNSEILFEKSAVTTLGDQLTRLIEEGGHSRLLLNFAGVHYLSRAMLARLACLERKLASAQGRIQLCELGPVLRDALRITRQDWVFDVYTDEAEALGSGFSENGKPKPNASSLPHSSASPQSPCA